MLLAGAAEFELFGLVVAGVMQQRVFVEHLVDRARELVFVGARFRLDGEVDRGFGEFHRLVIDRVGLVAESVAGLSVFQFRDGDDVAGVSLGDLLDVLALHQVQRAQALLRALADVVERRVGFDHVPTRSSSR